MLFSEQVHDGSGLLTSHVWYAAQLQPPFATNPWGWQWDSWWPFAIQPQAILAAHSKCGPHHDATGLLHLPVDKPIGQGLPSQFTPLPHILWPSLIHIVYWLTGSRIPSFQPCFCPLVGASPLTQLCLSAHSRVLQGMQWSTYKVYRHAQHMFLQFCHYYGLLPILADQDTLGLCYLLGQCYRPPAWDYHWLLI